MNYLEILEKIHVEIVNNPQLEIIEYVAKPGLNPSEMTKKVLRLRQVLPILDDYDLSAIVDLYKQCNGFKLRWKEKNSQEPKQGAIEILPFDEVFLFRQDYFDVSIPNPDGTYFLNTHYPDNTFADRLFVFDAFSEFEGMAFVFDESSENPQLVKLTDYYVVWDSSKITELQSYFYFLQASRGCLSTRHKTFQLPLTETQAAITFDAAPFGTEVEPEIFRK